MARSALIESLRGSDPAQIGGYTLIGRLGAGAMGQVYLGRSAAGRLVAVKTIRIEYAGEATFRSRFAQEVAAARRVSGAFTAAVVAADPEADVPWLATTYVPAPSLSTLVLACGTLSVPAVRWLAAGCAEALESIHGVGLVHRDLKPSNVLVSPDGPRVIDFGIARASERIQVTLTRGSVGTPAFMAPEQARDSRLATTASDIYSLGATMLLASTGHAPYRGETVMDVLAQLATRPPDLTGLPPELVDIVTACLDADPGRRPTSAALLAHMAAGLGQDDRALDLGHALLSVPARALIADYRRGLRPLTQPDAEPSADETLGSRAAPVPGSFAGLGAAQAPEPPFKLRSSQVPWSPSELARTRGRVHFPASPNGQPAGDGPHPGPGRNPADRPRQAGDRSPPSGGQLATDRRRSPPTDGSLLRDSHFDAGDVVTGHGAATDHGRRALAVMATLVAAAALLAGGTAIGTYLANERTGGRADAAGRTTHRDNRQPPGFFPPPVNVRAEAARTGRPAVAINQTCGDPHTTFVVLGAGFTPGRPVTIRLAGVGISPDHPFADDAGVFNYVINQAREFFPGPVPPGKYRVVVTARGGTRRTARFIVKPGRMPPIAC